ncbi:MAG: branched-chain amino acid ABC transporter permease [Actinobacteria bacterium]|nr:MAG: branched-chain amino acid ABC transporter permease [Actinomycetota bacterium]
MTVGPLARKVLRTLPAAALWSAILAVPLVIDNAFVVGKVLVFVGINVIIVTGLALLFGYGGQVSLGHAAFYGIGAYASGFATVKMGWPWLAGVGCAIGVSALGGLLLSFPSLRLRGHYLAMATLGFGEIMQVVFVEAKGVTGGTDGMLGIPAPAVGRIALGTPEASYWLVWIIAGAALLLAGNVTRSRPGRALRAMHGSEAGAQACGIDLTVLKVQVFVVSAALAGLAGSLYAHVVGFVSPTSFGLHTSVMLLAMAVLGGAGSLAGPAVAAAAFTLLPYVDALVPGLPRDVATAISEWEIDIYGLAIILVMLLAPGGAAGLLRRLRRKPRTKEGSA